MKLALEEFAEVLNADINKMNEDSDLIHKIASYVGCVSFRNHRKLEGKNTTEYDKLVDKAYEDLVKYLKDSSIVSLEGLDENIIKEALGDLAYKLFEERKR